MSARSLRPWGALGSSLQQLWRHPWPLLAFSASTCSLHLLGWGLFSSAESGGSAVLNTTAHLLGIALYFGSLIWMIDGFTRAGLCLAADEAPRAADLFRWHGPCSWRLSQGLLLLLGLISLILMSGFGLWALLLLLLPPLAPLAVILVVVLTGGLALSQIFLACWIVSDAIGPLIALKRGLRLLPQRAPALLALAAVLLLIALMPLVLGLIAEVLIEGLGVLVTAVALVIALPLLASTVTNSFVRWTPQAIGSLKRDC